MSAAVVAIPASATMIIVFAATSTRFAELRGGVAALDNQGIGAVLYGDAFSRSTRTNASNLSIKAEYGVASSVRIEARLRVRPDVHDGAQ